MSEKYQALRDLCAGYPQWQVVKDNGIVIWFGYDNSSTPERDAKFWLESHQRDYPERFAGYEVKKEIVQTELQRQALALLADHDRLLAQVEGLRLKAERYDWLREHAEIEYSINGTRVLVPIPRPPVRRTTAAELDAAVDAARSAAQGGSDGR